MPVITPEYARMVEEAEARMDPRTGQIRPYTLPNREERSGEPSAPVDPRVGQVVDSRIRLDSVIWTGGVSTVYRATQLAVARNLAVKVLRTDVAKDDEIVQRFRAEAQCAAGIDNDHIVEIRDFGRLPDGTSYYVMEYLDGISLSTALTLEPRFGLPRAIKIAMQVCDALGAVHEDTIVHRDLKPDNVWLVRRGDDMDVVKIIDFGVASVGLLARRLTRAGAIVGTPHFMSPEQCAGTTVDERTDIYALGIILYLMVTGRVPFDADNLMGILLKHLHEAPTPPSELAPEAGIPAALDAIILKAMAKDRDERYPTMRALHDDLERLEVTLRREAKGEGSGTPPSSRPQKTVKMKASEPRPSRAVLALAAIAVAMFAGALLYAMCGR